jgi:murein DD-endopeptidase MepM/ murein hydrolase activator NlpD
MFVGCCTIPASAKTESELREEIKNLEAEEAELEKELNAIKNKKNEQIKLRNVLEAKINNLQAQINACNRKIEANNSVIAENEAEIAQREAEMEQVLFEFKARIRSIYMSGSTAGGLEILLGAETFSDFIALSQLTKNVSKRDQKMVDEIVDEMKEIQAKTAENRKLIEELNNTKATLKIKQDELDKDADKILDIIKDIQADQNIISSEKAQTEAEIKKAEEELESMLQKADDSEDLSGNTSFTGMFIWPCPGYTNITSGYGYRWGKLHKGIDVSQGGISGKKVVAAAAGKVTVGCNTCTHNYAKYKNGKVYSCGCGGGYGNYVIIDHGYNNGYFYRTVYAHLQPGSISVSSGQMVAQGQKIGAVGTTGNSSGYHLHFEVRRGTSNGSLKPVNPKNFY